MLEWVRQHWLLSIIAVFAASAIFSEYVLHLTWPRKILSGISVALVALVYLTVFALTAITMKVMGRRLLPDFRKTNPSTYWTKREKTEPTLDSLKRQG